MICKLIFKETGLFGVNCIPVSKDGKGCQVLLNLKCGRSFFFLVGDILTSQDIFCCADLFGWLVGWLVGWLGRFFTFLCRGL
jgi:hypothetical protein